MAWVLGRDGTSRGRPRGLRVVSWLAGAFACTATCLGTVPDAVSADFTGHGGPVRAIAISTDGMRAISAGFDYSVILWDMATRRPNAILHGHDKAVSDVAFLPGADRAVSGGDDGAVILWDLDAREAERRYEGHIGKVAAVSVSPDANRIASAGWDGTVRIWPVSGGEPIVLEGHEGPVNAVAFVANGQQVASAGYDGTLRLWHADGTGVSEVVGSVGLPINHLAVIGTNTEVITAGSDETVRLWSLSAGQEEAERAYLIGHHAPVLSISVSPNGRYFATGGGNGRIVLWSLETGQAAWETIAHDGPVWSLAFSPDGEIVFSAGSEGEIRRWAAGDGHALSDHVTSQSGDLLPEDAAPELIRGAKVFRKCAICHTVTRREENRAGPTLAGIFGRPVGSVEGYPYSPALQESDIIWNEDSIGRLFAEGPHAVVPGTKMPLQRISRPEDRRDLIAFLKFVTRETAPK